MKTSCSFLLICLIMFNGIFLVGCQQTATVPQQLIGVWTTSAPRYVDRYVEFTINSLIFGIGNGEYRSHFIHKIKVKQKNNKKLYTFHYKDSEGETWTLRLTYNPDAGGTIQLSNRNAIWKKSDQGKMLQ